MGFQSHGIFIVSEFLGKSAVWQAERKVGTMLRESGNQLEPGVS